MVQYGAFYLFGQWNYLVYGSSDSYGSEYFLKCAHGTFKGVVRRYCLNAKPFNLLSLIGVHQMVASKMKCEF